MVFSHQDSLVVVGEPDQGSIVVSLSGDWDLANADSLGDGLRAVLRRGGLRSLALDMTAVEFCDCAVLRMLLGFRADARRNGCEVLISAASPQVAWLLGLMALQRVFGYQLLESKSRDSSG
jgi:anti-anti-sigma factor